MVLIYLLILAWIAYAILRELEARKTPRPRPGEQCPGCEGRAEPDWIACPRCRTLLRDHCAGCGSAVGAYHRFCPWCGTTSRGRAQ